ncbi:hypothetical protein [Erwinia sp. SLM-02]
MGDLTVKKNHNFVTSYSAVSFERRYLMTTRFKSARFTNPEI